MDRRHGSQGAAAARRHIAAPDLPEYRSGPFRPTQVAADEVRLGGSGDIWIADGYGADEVHRFSAAGGYLGTLTGLDGAGRFGQPHSVFIDRRGRDPELCVADRVHRRIQVYDLDSRFKRSFGEGFLLSPSGFAPYGDFLLIAELDARIVVVGPDNNPVGRLGRAEVTGRDRAGWPNVIVDGRTARPSPPPGQFNTPHALATDSDGAVYVVEWLVGGRLSKLNRVPRGTGISAPMDGPWRGPSTGDGS